MKLGKKRTDMEVFWVIFSSLWRCFRLGAIKFNLDNEAHLFLRFFVFFMAFISLMLFPWPDFIYLPSSLLRYLIWDFFLFAAVLILLGSFEYCEALSYEKSMENATVVNSKGAAPKVKSFKRYVDNTLCLDLDIWGMDSGVFEKKKKIIESTFDLYVHRLEDTESPRYKKLWLTSKTLPKVFHFKNAIDKISAPYHIVIGMAIHKPILSDLSKWPHGLIAGSTGSGKSVQMKSIIAQFIYSSPYAQIILCDLKGGVEFSSFRGFENVKIYSEIEEIAFILDGIAMEMEDRFKLMKEKGIQKIEPRKHKRPFIFIAIDESSLLYRRVHKGHSDHSSIELARNATQKILKLGRAAKISVLFGLQRPSKESIDTEIQENIDARMCFKINTIEGSIRMLGHKKGVELPSIPGRGIWKMGNDESVFQAPYIENKDIEGLKLEKGKEFNSSKEGESQCRKLSFSPKGIIKQPGKRGIHHKSQGEK